MEQRTMLISEITKESKNWTARVTVAEEIVTMICGNGAQLKRYVFTDSEGNEIAAYVYGSDINYLAPILQQYNVVDVTNAEVISVDPPYRILKNSNQWRIGRATLISHVPDAEPNFLYFLNNLTPFGSIDGNYVKKDIPVDIMGIIIAADECKPPSYSGTSTNQFQRFTFINNQRRPMVVTVWDPILAEQKNLIMDAVEKSHVVVAKRLRATTFKGISLKTRNSSSLTFNPPLDAAAELKTWFHSLSNNDLHELRGDQAIAISTQLVQKGKMKIYSLAEVEQSTESRDYWVKGFLQLIDEDQKFFYVGCNNCFSKINISPGIAYSCNVCKKNVVSTLRPIVAMCVTDATYSTKVIAVQNIAERIIQTTAEKIFELMNLGQQYEIKSIRAGFEGKIFLMLLHRSFSKRQETQKRLLLIEYTEADQSTFGSQMLHSAQSSHSNISSPECIEKGKSSEYPLSPLKRQLSEIRISSGTSAKKQLMTMSSELSTEYHSPDADNN